MLAFSEAGFDAGDNVNSYSIEFTTIDDILSIQKITYLINISGTHIMCLSQHKERGPKNNELNSNVKRPL